MITKTSLEVYCIHVHTTKFIGLCMLSEFVCWDLTRVTDSANVGTFFETQCRRRRKKTAKQNRTVTSMKPSVFVYYFPCRRLVVQISLHNLWTSDTQFTSLVWTNSLLRFNINHLQRSTLNHIRTVSSNVRIKDGHIWCSLTTMGLFSATCRG